MALEKWEAVISVLGKAKPEEVERVCHFAADSYCRDKVTSPDQFLSIWSLEEWWQVRKGLTDFMKSSVGRSWSRDQINQELGSLDSSLKKVVSDTISVHQQELKRKLIVDTTAISHAVLSDFDWKLKLAMSSDKIATLHEPLLQVDLDIHAVNGERKQVFLELNKSELVKLISSLESCSKSVQQVTTSST